MKSSGHPGFLHILRHSFICHPSSAPPTSRITRIGSQRTSSPKHFATLIQKLPAGLHSANKYYTRTFAKAFKSEQGFISALPGASSFYHSRDSQLPDTTALLTRRADNTARGQTSQIYKSAPSPHVVLQSSVGIWSTALVCGIIGSAVTYFLYHTELGPGKDAEKNTTNHSEQLDICTENWSKMTAEALPGRPGTLTPDQEDKLKEFWVATLKVFGVLDESEAKAAIENGDGRVRSDTTSTTDKKPKKRKALFSRKKKDDDKNSPTMDSGDKITDVEDKYGQTREFHDALANMSPETLRTTFWSMVKHDHPDALLLRFLRARKWDVERALVMMVSTMRWRATEMHVDADIMVNGELGALEDEAGDGPKKGLGHDFLAQMRMGKSFLHGTDNQGRPMCFVRARLHKQGEQSEESLERYTVFLIESARMILNPPIDTAMVFFDMTGFGLSNMDYGPVKFMIKCFEANYPESLGVVLIHKAPWVFQGIWKIVKGWLDPVVASKVNFTNNLEDLEVYIPKSQIIKELGGEENWSYEYVEPVPGENAKMADTETRDKLLAERSKIYKEYEKVTIEWISGEDEAKGKRNEIAKNLGQDYWQLDPYVRARSFYDRTGMLNPGGKVNFYPSRAPNGVAHIETEKPINGAVAVPIKPETSADDVD